VAETYNVAAKTEDAKVTVDRDELLGLLDHVDSLVRFCAVHMPDVARYTRGGKAIWAVAQRLAGNNEIADGLINEINGVKADGPAAL
jgi:hypothetical protein